MLRRSVIACAVASALLVIPVTVGAKTWEVMSDTLNPGQRLTDALANAQNGDRIHVHAPGTYMAPDGGWLIKKAIELFGDGRGVNFTDYTVLRANSGPVLVLDPSETPPGRNILENIYIHDLQIRGDTTSTSSNCNGIVFDNAGAQSNKVLGNLRLERLHVSDMANDGIRLNAANIGEGAIVGLTIIDVNSQHNEGNGLTLNNATLPYILRGYFSINQNHGAKISNCNEPNIISGTFENNEIANTCSHVCPQLFLEGSTAFTVQGCHFESFNQQASKTAITVVGAYGGYIGSNTFSAGLYSGTVAGTRGIYVFENNPGGPCNSVVIGPNEFAGTDVLVELSNSPYVTSCVVEPQSVLNGATGGASKIIVPEVADRGHILMPAARVGNAGEWAFNLTAGIELPRLSAAKRDSMPLPSSGGNRRSGLLVYSDGSKRLEHWDGSRWLEGITSVVGSEQNFANQTSSISLMTILSAPPAGLYRVTVYAVTKTLMTGAGAGQTINVKWTDEEGTEKATGYTLAKNKGSIVQATTPMYINSGDLKLETVGSVGTGAFSLRIRVEALP